MARPQLHPRTKTYWLRKRVPADLVAVVGKREEFFSLQTADPGEAKRRHAEELLKLEQRWLSLRKGPSSLTEEQAHGIARAVHDAWIAQHRAEPSQETFWRPSLGVKVFAAPPPVDMAKYGAPEFWALDPDVLQVSELQNWCLDCADHELQVRGLIVDETSRVKLAKAVATAMQRASVTLQRLAVGERDNRQASSWPNAGPVEPSSPSPSPASVRHPATRKVSLTSLVEAWWQEAKAAGKSPSTYESYAGTMRALASFLKHDDATRVTPENMIGFKDHRLSKPTRSGKPLSPRTVKNSDLAGLKSVFGWAVANRKLPMNPAEKVTGQTGPRSQTRDPSFSQQEAETILRAARDHRRGQEFAQTFAAKRWVSWLMAYTGARVGEIASPARYQTG